MALGTKAFVWNRGDDWESLGLAVGTTIENGALTAEGEKGLYFSHSLDTLEAETVWHRLRMQAEIPENTAVQLYLYCCDDPRQAATLDGWLSDPLADASDKEQFFIRHSNRKSSGFRDILLFEEKGRYLWFCLCLFRYGAEKPVLREMKIEFPRIAFVDYLPQIYRGAGKENSFLARFICVFQSLYLDLEDRMDETPEQFDADMADPVFLNWLTEWLAVSESHLWEGEKLRYLLKNAIRLYKKKGTREVLREVITLYTGEKPLILEQFALSDTRHWQEDPETFSRLFGAERRTFTVLLPGQRMQREDYAKLLRIIDRFRPVDAVCNLVFYENDIRLGTHSYLGMNSYVGGQIPLVLDREKGAATLFLVKEPSLGDPTDGIPLG